MDIEVWADGASCGNSLGPGGWCALIKIDDQVNHTVHGGDPKTTNNVMELQAVIGGLESLIAMFGINGQGSGHNIMVVSDSNYVISAFNDGWVVKWLLHGWRKSLYSDTLRPNAEVWQKLVALVSSIEGMGNKITWKHVNGHVGIPENEYCDKIAKQEKERIKMLSNAKLQSERKG